MKQTISKSNNTHQTDQLRRPVHYSYVAAAVLLLVSLLYAGVMLHWFVVDHTLAFSWSYAIPTLAIRWHTIMVIAEIWLAAGLGWLVGYVAHRGSTQPWRGPVACAAASAITYVVIVASLNGPIATFVVSLGHGSTLDAGWVYYFDGQRSAICFCVYRIWLYTPPN